MTYIPLAIEKYFIQLANKHAKSICFSHLDGLLSLLIICLGDEDGN